MLARSASLLCFFGTPGRQGGSEKVPPGYYIIKPDRGQEKLSSFLKKVIHRISTKFPQVLLFTNPTWLCIIIHMKNENKRPTKKALVKMLEDKGVDKAIVASLQRANIDTLIWVVSKIS